MRVHDRPRRAGRAFTLIEILVAIGTITVALGVATTLLMSAHKRFRLATDAAGVRARLALAADRMLADIRGSAGAEETDGALVLTKPDATKLDATKPNGGVTWSLRKGSLVRESGGDEHVYDLGLAAMRVEVEKRPGGAPFVEVAFGLGFAKRRRVPSAPAPVLYVAGAPRLGRTP